ncbi:NADH:flavin oxidoreductase [Chloroflexota bacterium]
MASLFDPIEIKDLLLKNRVVMPPMYTGMAPENGEVTDRHIEHYSARARGGAGLIIIEHTYISPEGKMSDGQLGMDNDRLIPGLKRLVDTIHSEGSKIVVQINHGGAQAPRDVIGLQPAGPWDIIPPNGAEAPRPLAISEIKTLIKKFGEAAERAIAAGFDSVEIHGAHGYLLGQFLSPLANQRGDIYGGNPEGRLLFPLEVISEVKSKLGQNVPLFYRIGADDMIDGGLTPKDGKLVAVSMEKAGVDVIDVSGGIGGTGRDRYSEQGYFIPLAEGIKKVVKVPVIGVGNITEPEYANGVVEDGRVDLVAFGRILLANSEFPNEAAQKLGVT